MSSLLRVPLLFALAVFALPACDAFGFEQKSLLARAANDMRCDEEHLSPVSIGSHSWEVSGCKRTRTYTCLQGEGIGENQWACLRDGAR